MLRMSMGQLLVRQALPEEMRDKDRILDKKGMGELLNELATKHPDKYVEVAKKLNDIGRTVATEFGGYTFGLEHLKTSAVGKKYADEVRTRMKKILARKDLTPEQRNDLIVKVAGMTQQKTIDDVYAEGLKQNNPLAMQVLSGSRGNPMNFASLVSGDRLYSDHRDRTIPLPVLSSYSQGLRASEHWASTYGARRGTMATKFATQDAGFLSKQLNQVAHRLMIVDEDDPRDNHDVGLPVNTDDVDNEGALLARDVGPYKRNTVVSPKIARHLKGLGHERILLRSPLVGGSPDGGVYSRDVGIRERGVLPGRGEQVGLTAAQALSEPLAQGQLSAKHSGGVAGQEKAVGGFAYINQLIQVPKTFKGGAAHSEHDGTVTGIEEAPAGGKFVYVDGKKHYVGTGYELKVKKGDAVEAGDVLSEGFPNPQVITRHKGVGEGKRYFTDAMVKAMKSAGMKVHRRNVELLARGLINHVRLTDEFGDYVPDDTVPYSTLEHAYQPREGHQLLDPGRSLNKYLEKPILHYSVGTKIRPSVLKEIQHFGIKELAVHDQPPPFEPEMIRGMYSLQHDPDWMTRMYGSGLKESLKDSTARGGTSDELGTSFVPSLARAVDFGRVGSVRQPEAGIKPPPEGTPFPAMKKAPSVQLDLPVKAMPEQKKPGFFSGLFKTSEEQEKEAKVLLARAARPTRQIGGVRPVRQINSGRTKAAGEPFIGSSTTTVGGVTNNISGQANKVAPPQGPKNPFLPGNAEALPGASSTPPKLPTAPTGGAPTAAPAPAMNPPAPPGEMHPGRAEAMGYAHRSGLMGQMDSTEDAMRFVNGGGQDADSGFGGQLGAVTRFGSLFDTDAVNTLTSGNRYSQAKAPQQSGQFGMGDPDEWNRGGGVETPKPATPATPASGVPSTTAAGVGVLTSPLGAGIASQLPGWAGRNLSKLFKASPWIYGATEAYRGLTQTEAESREKADSIFGAAGTNLRPDGQEPGTYGALKHFAESPGKSINATGQAISDAESQARRTSDQNIQFAGARAGVNQVQRDALKAKAANPATPLTPQESAQLAKLTAPLADNSPESFGNSGTTYEHGTNAVGTALNALFGPEDGGGPLLIPTDKTRAADYHYTKQQRVRDLQTQQKVTEDAAKIVSAPDPAAAMRAALAPQSHSTIIPAGGFPATSTQIETARKALEQLPAGPGRDAAAQTLQKQIDGDKASQAMAMRKKNISDEVDFRTEQELNRRLSADRDRASRPADYSSTLRMEIRRKMEAEMEAEVAKFQTMPLSRDPGSARPGADYPKPFYPSRRDR